MISMDTVLRKAKWQFCRVSVVVEMQIPAAAAPSQTTTAIADYNADDSGAFYRVARLAGPPPLRRS